ncbi:MAG: hypothetical protein ABIA63_10740 [bacterium]
MNIKRFCVIIFSIVLSAALSAPYAQTDKTKRNSIVTIWNGKNARGKQMTAGLYIVTLRVNKNVVSSGQVKDRAYD